MIRYLPHNEIDKQKWDDCILNSLNGLVYGCAWYLDNTCPQWDALIEDNYTSVMPLPTRKKYGFNYIYRPAFTQQLGVFTIKKIDENLLSSFLKAIPEKYQYINFTANSSCNISFPGYNFKLNKNFELDIKNKTYDEIYSCYSSNHKRNIKKAQSFNLKSKQGTLDELTSFMLEHNEKHVHVTTEELSVFRNLAKKALDTFYGQIICIYSAEDILLASAFVTTFRDRVTYLLPVSSSEGKEKRAMFFLIDNYIKTHLSQSLIFDFEGSNIQNIASFYAGFGAVPVLYPHIIINKLPWYVRFLK